MLYHPRGVSAGDCVGSGPRRGANAAVLLLSTLRPWLAWISGTRQPRAASDTALATALVALAAHALEPGVILLAARPSLLLTYDLIT